MSIGIPVVTGRKDRPLTKADVERRLQEVGSPNKLNLTLENLEDVDLSHFGLSGANLSGANLHNANLSGANLSGANLHNTNLSEANLSGANLRGTDLSGANLSGANLRGTDLSGANLRWAFLSKADLSGADLRNANLSGADLRWAVVSDAIISQSEKEQLHGRGVFGLSEPVRAEDSATSLRIRITETPLTAPNLTNILSALTELITKCWLIQRGRFGDLIEYMQTHNPRFSEETNTIITGISYHSPVDIGFKIDLSPEDLAKAINDIARIKQNLKKAELDNQEKAEQIQQSAKKADQEYQAKQQELLINAQKATQESHMGQLEQEMRKFELEKQRLTFQIELEKQKFELEKQRLEMLEKRLEIQRKEIEYALEVAGELIDALQPNADQATRAMAIQTLLPNILQLQNGKGLELALPAPQGSEEKIESIEITETTENG